MNTHNDNEQKQQQHQRRRGRQQQQQQQQAFPTGFVLTTGASAASSNSTPMIGGMVPPSSFPSSVDTTTQNHLLHHLQQQQQQQQLQLHQRSMGAGPSIMAAISSSRVGSMMGGIPPFPSSSQFFGTSGASSIFSSLLHTNSSIFASSLPTNPPATAAAVAASPLNSASLPTNPPATAAAVAASFLNLPPLLPTNLPAAAFASSPTIPPVASSLGFGAASPLGFGTQLNRPPSKPLLSVSNPPCPDVIFEYKLKLCKIKGCPNPPKENSNFCPSHKKEANQERTRKIDEAHKIAEEFGIILPPRPCAKFKERIPFFDIEVYEKVAASLVKNDSTSSTSSSMTRGKHEGVTAFIPTNKPDSLKDTEDHHFSSFTYLDEEMFKHFLQTVKVGKKTGPYHPKNSNASQQSVVRQLGNAEYGASLDKLFRFEPESANVTIQLLKKVQLRLIEEVLKSPLKPLLMEANGLEFSELFTIRIQGKEHKIPPNAFAAVDIHPCLAQDSVAIVMYHKDKKAVSSLAAFYGIGGISHNLIAGPGKRGSKAAPYIEEEEGDYDKLKEYMKELEANSPEEHAQVKLYLDLLLKKCEKGERVLVVFMVPGRIAMFNAEERLHGTIVPKGVHRCLAIFYWLDPKLETFWRENTPEYNYAMKNNQVGTVAEMLRRRNHQYEWKKKHSTDDPLANISNATTTGKGKKGRGGNKKTKRS